MINQNMIDELFNELHSEYKQLKNINLEKLTNKARIKSVSKMYDAYDGTVIYGEWLLRGND